MKSGALNIRVLAWRKNLPPRAPTGLYLVADNWNDFGYTTTFVATYVSEDGVQHDLGTIKIAEIGLTRDLGRPKIPPSGGPLGDRFFSLGQDRSYYESIAALGDEVRQSILSSLRDIAFDDALYRTALSEDVTQTSLFRSIARQTVEGQYRRIARGGAVLTPYAFQFLDSHADGGAGDGPSYEFRVVPESLPPTNIHVLIGRNGVGKTVLLNRIARTVLGATGDVGVLEDLGESPTDEPNGALAGVVHVTFSAFDPYHSLSHAQVSDTSLVHTSVGLSVAGSPTGGERAGVKTNSDLEDDFVNSLNRCGQLSRIGRWRETIGLLRSDPVFAESGVLVLEREELAGRRLHKAREYFRKMSSGHKIVLLTATRLVETVEERTLVLIDEPESHLHPPLLSAYIRALAVLLSNRNGIAIIATHSPVVLQEVPRSCVWRIHRAGSVVRADRPEMETFGENVGVLTREVFGLEVTESGFHTLLKQHVDDGNRLEDIEAHFRGQLGGEARAIARVLVAERDRRGAT